MKKWLAGLLAVLMMMPGAWAETVEEQNDVITPLSLMTEENGTLSMDELTAWADAVREKASASVLQNDPSDPRAKTEDGYAFVYDFATLYLDRPAWSADAAIQAIVVNEINQPGPRGTAIDQSAQDVLRVFYNENERLDGDATFASLYLLDLMPASASWGWVQREGQDVLAIQYTVHEQLSTGGDGYTNAGLVYTIQDGLVAAIRAYGLNARISKDDLKADLAEAHKVAALSGYKAVETSNDGSMLRKFGADDLTFAGISFLTVTPKEAEKAFGKPLSDTWMKDDNGEHLRTMTFASCEMTFVYNKQKKNPKPYLLAVTSNQMEGPRSIRLGDSFSSDLIRFRFGEGKTAGDGLTEQLYGTEQEKESGFATYGNDASASLRYVMTAEDGRRVVLELHYVMMYLSDWTLHAE